MIEDWTIVFGDLLIVLMRGFGSSETQLLNPRIPILNLQSSISNQSPINESEIFNS